MPNLARSAPRRRTGIFQTSSISSSTPAEPNTQTETRSDVRSVGEWRPLFLPGGHHRKVPRRKPPRCHLPTAPPGMSHLPGLPQELQPPGQAQPIRRNRIPENPPPCRRPAEALASPAHNRNRATPHEQCRPCSIARPASTDSPGP